MPKRDERPPYEIMGRPSGGEPAGEVRPAQKRGPGVGSPWWVGSSAPLVLRVPRGAAVAVVAGVVALVVLAYWVGYISGGGGSNEAESGQVAEYIRRPPPPRQPADGQQPEAGTAAVGDEPGPTDALGRPDPREAGLNYKVLARRQPKDAGPLMDFLETQGVDTIAVSTRGDSLLIIAVNKGVKGVDLKEQSTRDYDSWLREAGRAWKKHNRGRGDDLSSMYWDKYEGPDSGS